MKDISSIVCGAENSDRFAFGSGDEDGCGVMGGGLIGQVVSDISSVVPVVPVVPEIVDNILSAVRPIAPALI